MNEDIRGVDLSPERRPGVPMRQPPALADGAHWKAPEQQQHGLARRPELRRLTPVFGTAVPVRGLSGVLRRVAYRIPDHRARHWLLLIFADRIDALESAGIAAVRRPAIAFALVSAVIYGASRVLRAR